MASFPFYRPRKLRLRGSVNLPMSESKAVADPVPSLRSDIKHSFYSKAQRKTRYLVLLLHYSVYSKFSLLFLPKLPFLELDIFSSFTESACDILTIEVIGPEPGIESASQWKVNMIMLFDS